MKMARAVYCQNFAYRFFFFFSIITAWLLVALLEVFILFIIMLGFIVAVLIVFLIFLRNDLLQRFRLQGQLIDR